MRLPSKACAAFAAIILYPGYITRIECDGKLLLSSVGNDQVVILQALPSDLGCGVLLKPKVTGGRSNVLLETSTGTVERIIEIKNGVPESPDLKVHVSGGGT